MSNQTQNYIISWNIAMYHDDTDKYKIEKKPYFTHKYIQVWKGTSR